MSAWLAIVLAAASCPFSPGEPHTSVPQRAARPAHVWLLGANARVDATDAAMPLALPEEGASLVISLSEAPADAPAGAPAGIGADALAELVGALGFSDDTQAVSLPADGDAPELAATLRDARAVAFTGGAIPDWFETFFPDGRRSAAALALWEARGRGALLVGRGEQALLMSAGFLAPSLEPYGVRHRNPRRTEPPHLVYGLGLAPLALVDTDGRSGGRLEELLRTVVEQRVRIAVYLNPESGVAFEPNGAELVGLTAQPAWLFDLRQARKTARGIEGGRLTMLCRGARWMERGRALADSERTEHDGRTLRAQPDDALASPAWLAAFAEAEPSLPQVLELTDGTFTVTIRADARTRRVQGPQGTPSLGNLRFDLRW